MPTTPTTRRLKGPTCGERTPSVPAGPSRHLSQKNGFRTETCSYLDVDARPQQVAHLLQDLLLQSVPGDHAVHVEHKRQPKPAAGAKGCRFSRTLFRWLKSSKRKTFLTGLPLSLVAATSSVTHQEDHFLGSHEFIG